MTLFIWNTSLNTESVVYSFFNPGDKICSGLLEKHRPRKDWSIERQLCCTSEGLSMLHLSNNGGFVTGVCFSLEGTSNDCRMPRSILLEDLNKRIITGNG